MTSIVNKSKPVVQKSPCYLVDSKKPGETITVSNVLVTDFGLVHANGGGEIITLTNVGHTGKLGTNNKKPGCYFVMLWAAPGQRAKRLTWDNSGLAALLRKLGIDAKYEWIRQNVAEAVFRCKVESCHIVGVKFRGAEDANGRTIKQVAELRDGVSYVFDFCEFEHSWPDQGQQKTKQPDGSSKYETGQQIGTVTYNNCKFHKWSDKKRGKVVSRQPGVKKIVYANCIDPDGQKFSRTD